MPGGVLATALLARDSARCTPKPCEILVRAQLIGGSAYSLMAAGLDWYEVSNWSRPGGECRHNIAYWRSDDWWGIGPGAHGHVDGVRW